MNPAQLLAQFHRIGEAPDAFRSLRRFILDLAVRGKLVKQDLREEPASELLKQIKDQKMQLVNGNKLRGNTTTTPIESEEGHFPIPASWMRVQFGEVMISRDGERVPVSKEDRNQRKKMYDYYGASGVIDKIDNYLFDKPLLLIGEDGANLISRSTPIAFIARGKYWVNNHAHVLDGISEDFLRFIELHINAIDLKPYVTGAAQPKMNQAKMNSIPLALPPLAEQHRIVAKVDELMALCDRLEAAQTERESRRDRLVASSLNRLNNGADPDAFREHARFYFNHLPRLTTRPDHIKQLRQTILNLAVRGKLVPQVETMNVGYRSGTLATQWKPSDKIADTKPNSEIQSNIPPFPLPHGWKWARVSDVLITRQGVQIPKEQQLSVEKQGYKRYLYISDFRHDDKLKFVIDQFPTKEVTEEDLVMANTAGPGEVFRGVPGILSNNLFKIAFDRLLFTQNYLFIFFTSPIFISAVQAELKGGAQQHLGHKLMGKQFVAIPPLAEQHRIVAKVDELMALCDQLETQLTTTQTESHNLLSSLLHHTLTQVI